MEGISNKKEEEESSQHVAIPPSTFTNYHLVFLFLLLLSPSSQIGEEIIPTLRCGTVGTPVFLFATKRKADKFLFCLPMCHPLFTCFFQSAPQSQAWSRSSSLRKQQQQQQLSSPAGRRSLSSSRVDHVTLVTDKSQQQQRPHARREVRGSTCNSTVSKK